MDKTDADKYPKVCSERAAQRAFQLPAVDKTDADKVQRVFELAIVDARFFDASIRRLQELTNYEEQERMAAKIAANFSTGVWRILKTGLSRTFPWNTDPPRVADMVAAQLAELGADGLVNLSMQCGCASNDLAPCGELGLDCQAARSETLSEPRGDFDAGDLIYIPLSIADPEATE